MLMLEADGDDQDKPDANDTIESHDAQKSEEHEQKDEGSGKKAKKRTLLEAQTGISEEELESYKRSRLDAADPMAAFIGKDTVDE